MGLNVKVDLRPMRVKCPDCLMTFNDWRDLARHWRRAWNKPFQWGKHYKPRKNKDG
jgi:uncharacterized C2H2 Zn-finger protein